jgi:sugar phosphate isomerase/epimerase
MIAFSTLACPDWTLPQMIGAAVAFGYGGIELRAVEGQLELDKLAAFSSERLPEVRRQLQDHAIAIVGIGTSCTFHTPDAHLRSLAVDSTVRMAELASALGAPAIRVFGDRIQPGVSRDETVNWIAEGLSTLTDRLAGTGVSVWLETHGDFTSANALTSILQKADRPSIGLIWDPVNQFVENGSFSVLPPHLAQRVQHVHIKDAIRTDLGAKYALPGQGSFPLSELIAVLRLMPTVRCISFEWEKLWHPELVVPEIALPYFTNWWRQQ